MNAAAVAAAQVAETRAVAAHIAVRRAAARTQGAADRPH